MPSSVPCPSGTASSTPTGDLEHQRSRECGSRHRTHGPPSGTIILRPSECEHYDGWMAQFCHEPGDDGANLATAIFLPCVQYSKIMWRLRQIDDGRDWSDDAWKAKNGCNADCWAQCMISAFLPHWVLPCLLRRQIRQRYNIKGYQGVDVLVSMCCPCPDLIHIDREVRAREGDERLRTSKAFAKHKEIIDQQPSPSQAMSYEASSIPRDEHRSCENGGLMNLPSEQLDESSLGSTIERCLAKGRTSLGCLTESQASLGRRLIFPSNNATQNDLLATQSGSLLDTMPSLKESVLVQKNYAAEQTVAQKDTTEKRVAQKEHSLADCEVPSTNLGGQAQDQLEKVEVTQTDPFQIINLSRPRSSILQQSKCRLSEEKTGSGSSFENEAIDEAPSAKRKDLNLSNFAAKKEHTLANCPRAASFTGKEAQKKGTTQRSCSTPSLQVSTKQHTLKECSTVMTSTPQSQSTPSLRSRTETVEIHHPKDTKYHALHDCGDSYMSDTQKQEDFKAFDEGILSSRSTIKHNLTNETAVRRSVNSSASTTTSTVIYRSCSYSLNQSAPGTKPREHRRTTCPIPNAPAANYQKNLYREPAASVTAEEVKECLVNNISKENETKEQSMAYFPSPKSQDESHAMQQCPSLILNRIDIQAESLNLEKEDCSESPEPQIFTKKVNNDIAREIAVPNSSGSMLKRKEAISKADTNANVKGRIPPSGDSRSRSEAQLALANVLDAHKKGKSKNNRLSQMDGCNDSDEIATSCSGHEFLGKLPEAQYLNPPIGDDEAEAPRVCLAIDTLTCQPAVVFETNTADNTIVITALVPTEGAVKLDGSKAHQLSPHLQEMQMDKGTWSRSKQELDFSEL